jgi:glutathione S-transferase
MSTAVACPIPHCLIPVAKHGPQVAKVAAALAVGLFVVRKVASVIGAARAAAAVKARHAAQQKGVVYVFGFPPHPTLGQLGAPSVKIETFLKLNKIKYEYVPTMDTSISPTERLPMIELDGVTVADSTYAIEYLIEKFNIAETLSPEQSAKGVAMRRILEDSARLSLYRFQMVDNMEVTVNRFTVMLPKVPRFVLALFMKKTFRKNLITMLNLHGHGDLTDEQYQQEFLADIKTIEQLLSQSQFAVADVPTRYDASVYGWLVPMRAPDLPVGQCPALAYAASSAVISSYMARVEAAVKA